MIDLGIDHMAKKSRSQATLPAARFTAVVTTDWRRRVVLPVPFDPDQQWGPKSKHHVRGILNDCDFRGVIEKSGDGWGIALGPSWRRDRGIEVGDKIDAALIPEGPQRGDLAPDIVTALDANPEAGAFFDSLAQFYRKGYLRWIDATKRSPAIRAERIAEMVRLLEKGVKQRG
jgi:hypothetical protein